MLQRIKQAARPPQKLNNIRPVRLRGRLYGWRRACAGKLCSRGGESLIEVLAAVLICTLSVLLLTSASMTASRMDKDISGYDEGYYDALNYAESRGTATLPGGDPAGISQTGRVTVAVDGTPLAGSSFTPVQTNVTYYGGKDVYSFDAN